MYLKWLFHSALLPTALALPLWAQSPSSERPDVRITVRVQREVTRITSSGEAEVRREPVVSAKREDVLVYTLEFANHGDSPAHEVQVMNPVPGGTVLIPETVQGDSARITYSIDGGVTYGTFPITRTVVLEDGTREEVPAAPEEYTHVRWTLQEPLEPSESRTVEFKVRVQ